MSTFFGLVNKNKILSSIRVKDFDINDMFARYQDDNGVYEFGKNYEFIYYTDFKRYVDKYIISDLLKDTNITCSDLLQDDYEIRLISSTMYREQHEDYDNICKFVEYIQSEKSECDRFTNITSEMLVENGFELLNDQTKLLGEVQKNNYGITNFKIFRKWISTKKSSQIQLTIDNGWTNRGTKWHLHIDNDVCETIGAADIDTVWEFNTLMEIFGSKFRLE